MHAAGWGAAVPSAAAADARHIQPPCDRAKPSPRPGSHTLLQQALAEPDVETADAADQQKQAQRGVPLAEVTANLEAVLREENGVAGDAAPLAATDSDLEAELEGFPRSGPQSFASLFTDDEGEVAAEVDPSLMLVNCGLSEKTVSTQVAARCKGCTAWGAQLWEAHDGRRRPWLARAAQRVGWLLAAARPEAGTRQLLAPVLLHRPFPPTPAVPPFSDFQVKALEERGITSLFPIQKTVFEPAMSGVDLIARAKTGSGKTLAFAIPVIEKIMAAEPAGRKQRLPQCLVLAPTRELAKQVGARSQASAPCCSPVHEPFKV